MKLRTVSFAVVALVAACGGKKASLPDAGAQGGGVLGVRVQKPKGELNVSLVRVTGTLEAKNDATLSAPATGTVDKIYVDVGDSVKSGQALVQLDTSNISIAVEQAKAARAIAEAAFEAANIELERAKQLRASDAAPSSVLDRATIGHKQAEAQLMQASAAVRSAEELWRDQTLRAPFDGVVTRRLVHVGETVAMMPLTPVVSLVDARRLEVHVAVPETVVDLITPGAVVKGSVSPSGKAFEAKVRAVGVSVNRQTRTVDLVADVTTELGREMRPGSIVDLDLSSLAADASVAGLYVPAQALQKNGEKNFVFVVNGEVAKAIEVKAEQVSPEVVRVREGLTPNDDVVIEGVSGLKDGDRVRQSS